MEGKTNERGSYPYDHKRIEPSLHKPYDHEEIDYVGSLPEGLEIRSSSIPGAGYGVFATTYLPMGRIFGPYGGKKVFKGEYAESQDPRYMWEIVEDGDVKYFIDGRDKKHGNWMRYVNCARVQSEQNMVAVQYRNYILYCTYKGIPKYQELLVWYGDKYAAELGICADNEGLDDLTETERKSCEARLTSGNRLRDYIKYFDCEKNLLRQTMGIIPKNEKARVGRPRKIRKMHCSICGDFRHNKLRCNLLPKTVESNITAEIKTESVAEEEQIEH